MNKFIVTGIPRAGTTVFCKTLDTIENIKILHKNHFFYEPFSIGYEGKYSLNPEKELLEEENKCEENYFGFKVFREGFLTPDYLINQGYRPIVLIRKNLWKSVISGFIQLAQASHRQDPTYSSKNTPWTESYKTIQDIPPFMRTRFVSSFGNRLMTCYRAERIWKNNIDIIYFEDLIKKDATFKKLNNYFKKEIVFNLNYDDSKDETEYMPGMPIEFFKMVSHEILQKLDDTDDIPHYITESLKKYL